MRKRRIMSLFLAVALMVSLAVPATAADSAATIRLSKTTGTVTVSKSSGKKLTQITNMRLYNGYHVTTEEKSYAWINLDDAKLIKEDAASEVEVRKDGKKLEVNACSGNLFFNVTEDLKEDETLNISTSTMVVGIRGTSGWLRVLDEWSTELFVLEGAVSCSVTDPVTGQVKTEQVRGGESVTCVVYPQDRTGDKCDIVRRKYIEGDIPGFVLTELVRDVPLCEEIEEETGLDILKDLAKDGGGDPSGKTPGGPAADGTSAPGGTMPGGTPPGGKTATPQAVKEAQRRQDGDEQELNKKIDNIKEQERRQPHTASPDKAFPKKQTSGPKNPAIDGGSGSSGGGSSATTPQPKPRTMKLKDVEVQALLEGRTSLTVQPNTDAADTTPKKNILEVDTGLTVTAGKTVNLQSGIDVEVYPGKRLQVDGTLWADGLQNNGTVAVTSGETLHLRGDLSNAGSLSVSATGRVVVDGVFSRSGPATLAQGARVQAKRFAAGSAPSGWEVSAGTDAQGYYSLVPQDIPPVTYTVAFQANGGAFADGAARKTAQTSANGTAAFPANPARENYIFAGWFTAAEGGTQVTASHVFQANTTLYAQWTEKAVWTLTFSANGGTFTDGAAQKTVQTGENGTAVFPADPARENFAFTGWFTAAEGGTQVTASHVFQANTTVYAQWKEQASYTVTFQANGGAFAGGAAQKTAQTDLETGLAVFPADPARENFVFSGWYNAPENGTRVTAADPFTQDTTLYAHWAQNVYTITFNAGEGAFADGSKQKTVPTGDDGTAPPPSDPTRTGDYRFAGWFTASSGGIKVDASYIFTKDTTVYAQWTSAYKITFHSGGGTYADGTTGMKYVMTNPDGTVDFPEITRVDYRLIGWYTQLIDGVKYEEDHVFTKDTSLVSMWERAATITFDANGGAFTDGTTTRTATTDAAGHVVLPTEVPVREGYEFDCWRSGPGGGAEITTATEFFRADTVYASWVKIYNITFDANEGAWADGSATKTAKTKSDTRVDLPAEEPTRFGFTFHGWWSSTVGGTQITEVSTFYQDSTVYAQWTRQGYLTTFEANGGAFADGDTQKVDLRDTSSMTITWPADPVWEGYEFLGWFDALEGGEQVTPDSTVYAVDQTLYARWKAVGFHWEIDETGTKLRVFGTGPMPDYTFASTTNSSPWYSKNANLREIVVEDGITTVGDCAFINTNATSIKIADSVTDIGDLPFFGNLYVTEITLPKNGFPTISAQAFSGCKSLPSIVIPEGVETIESMAFGNCTALTSVTLPNSVTTIKSQAFINCSSLKSVTIPSGVTLLESSSFDDCKGLESVIIQGNITKLDNATFADCSSLKSVSLPDSLREISYIAFKNCTSLETITIPANLTKMISTAFEGCTALKTIVFQGTKAQWEDLRYTPADGVTVQCADGVI